MLGPYNRVFLYPNKYYNLFYLSQIAHRNLLLSQFSVWLAHRILHLECRSQILNLTLYTLLIQLSLQYRLALTTYDDTKYSLTSVATPRIWHTSIVPNLHSPQCPCMESDKMYQKSYPKSLSQYSPHSSSTNQPSSTTHHQASQIYDSLNHSTSQLPMSNAKSRDS